jgi:hypothetical protein
MQGSSFALLLLFVSWSVQAWGAMELKNYEFRGGAIIQKSWGKNSNLLKLMKTPFTYFPTQNPNSYSYLCWYCMSNLNLRGWL